MNKQKEEGQYDNYILISKACTSIQTS